MWEEFSVLKYDRARQRDGGYNGSQWNFKLE